MVKISLLSSLFICTAIFLYGGGISEADIPMPEIRYELPSQLVGEFIIVSPTNSEELTIFPNNKYIIESRSYDFSSQNYGHIIQKDGKFYFNPLKLGYFYRQAEIILSDTGFSFYQDDYLLRVFRKTEWPPVNPVAKTISASSDSAKRQYFKIIRNDNTEHEIPFQNIFFGSSPNLQHSIYISEGSVGILRVFTKGEWIFWKGFLDNVEKNNNFITASIQFTNGVPYYYAANGVASITIDGDGLIVSIPCSLDVESDIRSKIPDALSPMYLILEF
jgi:hypothetical protein